jgi:hypothetical protein
LAGTGEHMRGFIAAVVALFVAGAIACAAGGSDGGPGPVVAEPDGGAVAEGGNGVPETSAPDVDAASPASDAGAPPVEAGERVDASIPDATASDAGRDADAESGTIPTLVAGSCDPTRWSVTASVSATNNPPAFAVDGLPPTRWSSGIGQAIGQYVDVDFGGFVVIDQITLDDSYGTNEHTDYARGVDVLGSIDGSSFPATLGSFSYATDPGAIVAMNFAPATTRAVRLQLNTGVPTVWWSIHELRVDCAAVNADGGAGGGDAEAGAPLDGGVFDGGASCVAARAGWSASSGISPASWKGSASTTGPNDTIQGAFDQNASTRWSSGQAQAGGEWFKIDLGQSTSISAVGLYLLNGNTGDSPSSYALELSTDDLAYATVATGLGAATTAICFPSQSARYLRVTQTGTGDASWWSIYEISVFP